MADITTIPKIVELPASQDYEFLRQEGLKHIEDLSHELWTDYNSHDPGVTILEALCYAITELGYRCGFDMKDLVLTEGSNITDNDRLLYTARQILTTNPITINDYRKLLIDLPGVQNAWLIAEDRKKDTGGVLIPINEIPLYADLEEDSLTTEKKPAVLFLSGLYQVLLDLEPDDTWGDMNTGDIHLSNPALTGKFEPGEFQLNFELPAWNIADFSFAEKAADTSSDHISQVDINGPDDHWKCTVTLDDASTQVIYVTIPLKPAGKKVVKEDIEAMLTHDLLHKLFAAYHGKITQSRDIMRLATKRLHETRNLCEDFITITTIDSEEISFCFDVDTTPAADIEKIQAEIYFAIENYLNPPIRFYSLTELLDQKLPVDEIFQGPVLGSGFIRSGELEQSQLRTVIHSSDIINLLMDIEGVLAIRNFVMTKFDESGKAVEDKTGLRWCLHISPLHKPVLAADKSKIILFKNQFPFLARYTEVSDTIKLLHAQRSRNKMDGFQQDIPIPAGRKRNTESYWPVQYELPQTYGVGESGLPSATPPERKIQQQQLKGYMLFFEQLLADFFSQMTHAHELLSTGDLTHSYYAQYLDNIKDMEGVYVTDGANAVIGEIITHPNSLASVRNGWQDLYEDKQLFQSRRTYFLDHLLARFAESFNDYALLMYRINYEDKTQERISYEELTAAKTSFLRNYPEISSKRTKAFNYYPQLDNFDIDTAALWDTTNISGLEKHICALTGIADESRRFLYCIRNIEILCVEKLVEGSLKCFHEFNVTTSTGIMMKNREPYDTKSKAEEAVLKVIELGIDKNNYGFDATGKQLQLRDGDNPFMETDKNKFNNDTDAMQAADAFVAEFSVPCNDPVGLHLIEHILLRPRDPSFHLLETCLEKGECPCNIDPYSFRVSVVMPYWPGHFDNMSFREYFEMKIAEEAPAHLMVKVCWLSNELMRIFEVAYKKWVENLAAYVTDNGSGMVGLKAANDAMVDIMKQLHSEYPLATLHDCDESKEGSNTVILGKTVLGTFKNQ